MVVIKVLPIQRGLPTCQHYPDQSESPGSALITNINQWNQDTTQPLYLQQSTGLGKLMSALHQNAASLVNTKAEHNGPDQILAATEFTSSVRNLPVLLRKEEVGLGAEEALSVPSLLQQVSAADVNVR